MRFQLILVLWTFCLMTAAKADEVPAAEAKPISLAKWQLSLQKDAAKILPGKTKAEHEAIVAEHIAKFREDHATATIEFTVKVKQVSWKDGIATINTTEELPAQQKGVIEIEPRRYALDFQMDQATATSIKPGAPIHVVAKLHATSQSGRFFRFRPEQNRTIVRWQAFYDVENTRLNCRLCGYCSGEYSAEIGGQTYPGAYSDPPEFK